MSLLYDAACLGDDDDNGDLWPQSIRFFSGKCNARSCQTAHSGTYQPSFHYKIPGSKLQQDFCYTHNTAYDQGVYAEDG